MRKRFIPSHYYRELYQWLQSLTQGANSVEDYHKDMEIVMIKANVEEDKEATMAQFLNGLNREIANMVELQHYVELEDKVHMAMKVERQLRCKSSSKFGAATNSNSSSSSWKSNWRNDEGTYSKTNPEPLKKKEGVPDVHKGNFDSQPSRTRDVKCFKCLGKGHIVSQCLNRCTMILREDGEVKTEGKSDEEPKQSLGEDNEGVEYPVGVSLGCTKV